MKNILIAVLVMAAVALTLAQNNTKKKGNVLKDKNGNSYTAKIMLDGKRWMTQNLHSKIPGSYCYDDKEANCGQYSRLYTWEAAKKACPMLGDGWRLPTDDEWREMAKHYGGVRGDAADDGKSAYQALRKGGSAEFNTLLGGSREPDGKYARLAAHGFYWSATKSKIGEAWFYNFAATPQILSRHSDGEESWAFSVRCIKP